MKVNVLMKKTIHESTLNRSNQAFVSCRFV
jgi:hypothetical protein